MAGFLHVYVPMSNISVFVIGFWPPIQTGCFASSLTSMAKRPVTHTHALYSQTRVKGQADKKHPINQDLKLTDTLTGLIISSVMH